MYRNGSYQCSVHCGRRIALVELVCGGVLPRNRDSGCDYQREAIVPNAEKDLTSH